MKRLTTLLLVVSFFLISSTVAARGNDPVGNRIDLVAGTPTSFPADTPFHVIHGWLVDVTITNPGHAFFEVDVDGVLIEGAFLRVNAGRGTVQSRLWLFNFPLGLPAGTYLITGHWYLSCNDAVDSGLFAGPCVTPNEPVEVLTIPLNVTFN